PPKRWSLLTALATFISGQWSIETLIGTLGVHLAFIGFLALRDRAFTRIVYDSLIAIAPAIAGVASLVVMTLVTGGALPDFRTYLAFLDSFNPAAQGWSIVASPTFFGWLPLFFVLLLAFGDAWMRIFRRSLTGADDELI